MTPGYAPAAPARHRHAARVPQPSHSIEERLHRARERIARWSPQEARERHLAGALLVDIRPYHQRVAEGEIPGSLVIERNVLEWRLDPTSPARIPQAGSHDSEFIVVCSEGYTSSLAAASLLDLGLARSGDLIGGAKAWFDQWLPHRAGGTSAGEFVPGSLHRAPDRLVDRLAW